MEVTRTSSLCLKPRRHSTSTLPSIRTLRIIVEQHAERGGIPAAVFFYSRTHQVSQFREKSRIDYIYICAEQNSKRTFMRITVRRLCLPIHLASIRETREKKTMDNRTMT
uniref:Uncharacterized protein n=1 Tax=Glypta fumiferanae TaxID=389681 RepID=A0A0F6T1E0_9HYME|nr:hypothetical protein [Glypta fumiferanae]